MFTYFHCYHPQTWEAQKERGLLDEHAGVRFMQTATLPEGTRKVDVRLKNGHNLNVLEGTKDIHFENGTYHFELQPGDWFLAELT